MEKKVSILIPGYKPQFFAECLQSAIDQTYPNIEIIVSDDCPTNAIRDICAQYSNVIYLRNPEPDGLALSNIRHLAQVSTGYYVKYLFDDDILMPDCVASLVETLEHTGAVLAFSPRWTIDKNGAKLNLRPGYPDAVEKTLTGTDVTRRFARHCLNLIGEFTTVLFPRSTIIGADGSVQMFTLNGASWVGLSDVPTFLHILQQGSLAMHPKPLSMFRVHAQSNSTPGVYKAFFRVVADWKLVVDYAIEIGALNLLDRLRCYMVLMYMFKSWRSRTPNLKAEFDSLLDDVRDDARTKTLRGPAWLVLRSFDLVTR